MVPRRIHLAALFSLVLATFLAPPLLAGDAAGAGDQLRKDYAIEWAGRISLFGVAAALALIAFVLAFRRRHVATPAVQWMLFLGICVMPLPVMLLGSAVGLERAKDVSFCEQCHVMRGFVADMRDPQSTRLAAAHFKNRYIQRSHCYVCHTDYGLFGTMEAKLAGMGHIWKESTGSYTLPVRIARPYQYMICLDCHAQSAKFQAVKEHEDLVARVARGEGACTECHGRSHPAPEEREARR